MAEVGVGEFDVSLPQSDQKPPPIKILPGARVIARPIEEGEVVDVPSSPLFAERLPVVVRAFGIKIGTDTHGKRTETVVTGGYQRRDPSVIDYSESIPFVARISSSGLFPHGRSFNYMRSGEVEAETMEIGGKEYSGISTKGGDFRNSRIEGDDHFYSGIRIHGLVTEDVAERMVQVSNWLLANGISSEVIWSVSRLNALPYIKRQPVLDKKGRETGSSKRLLEMVSPEEFKRRLILEAQERNTSLPQDKQIDIEKTIKYLESTNFVVINRATTVPFRLSDLTIPFEHSSPQGQAYQEFSFMINNMISYLNRSRSPQDQLHYLQIPEDKNDTQTINSNSQEVGMLHKLGVAHGFLHAGNITADGTFVDLDSPHGKPLGDEPISPNDLKKDVRLLNSIQNVTQHLIEAGVISRKTSDDIGQAFLGEYIEARWGEISEENVLEIQTILTGIIDQSSDRSPRLINFKERSRFNSRQEWFRRQIGFLSGMIMKEHGESMKVA